MCSRPKDGTLRDTAYAALGASCYFKILRKPDALRFTLPLENRSTAAEFWIESPLVCAREVAHSLLQRLRVAREARLDSASCS
jgi:hypothetical protein